MIIGVPKEIKNNECRVSLLPVGVESLVRAGHQVIIEHNAGLGSGVNDVDYETVGGEIAQTPESIFAQAQMIVKIKEPQPSEHRLLKKDQIVFTYFHFAASRELTEAMLERKITALAYETLQTQDGELPCLTPMSEVAGRMAVHEGGQIFGRADEGQGNSIGRCPGRLPGGSGHYRRRCGGV